MIMKGRGFFLLVLLSSITVGLAEANPQKNLTEVGTFTTQEPYRAEFFKDYLFIADWNSLLVYNTSNPGLPKLITRFTDFDEPRQVVGLSISGEQLYVASGPGWIYVLNISDPENPKRMYQINYPDSANDVAVSGKYMYVADSNTGMLIFDLSDRRNPELVGKFYVLKSNISGFFEGWGGIAVAVSGNYAFLSGAERQGFYIVDISDPTNPIEVFHSVGKNIYDIKITESGVYLALANGTSEFDLLDVSNPYSPKTIDSFFITETADRSAIAINPSGDYIYAASGNTWHIFSMPDIIPPDISIEKPKSGEISTDKTITVSGTAFDKSGVSEVLVNGMFAGKESWNQTVTLSEGINNISITAVDERGNKRIEFIQVIYSPSVQPTPVQTVTATPVQKAEVTKKPVVYNVIFAALIIAFLVLVYWAWKYKIKR
ncbi:LVIVD repeat protein [uncultured archaeon]|nr:LVIVD repeat protein [uncultured archaeon]